ncbi:hypothetical protein HS7_18990 [Sulfolobales archaeon HS-7]|nr:hypothetical protein HS7_18990 [Sulfolobales archaeon HS-7]
MRSIPAELCVRCKGHKLLCGLLTCPLTERFRATINISARIRKFNNQFSVNGSTPPSVLVGEKFYPKINVMLNVPPEVYGDEARKYEDPIGWWGKASLNDIIRYRSSMLYLSNRVDVKDPWKLYEKEISPSAISHTPVSTEAKIEQSIIPTLRFDGVIYPRGPTVKANNVRITDDPKIDEVMEKVIFDDIKASTAIKELYSNGTAIYKIIQALSLGLLGERKNRKLVPTRWAITAVDTTISKSILNSIREYQEYDRISLFYSKYLGNKFFVILYPSKYQSTWIEIWHPMTPWSGDLAIVELKEDYFGKYEYMDGGYMAARLSILEHLNSMKRQAGVIIIREITSDYFAPVGNWHIRETVKNLSKMGDFENLEDTLRFVKNRLTANIDLMSLRSIKTVLGQRRIDSYFS